MRRLLLALIVSTAFEAPLFAQSAQIVGTIKDSTGGVIPGATVTARNVNNGFTRSTVTEAAGDYRLQALPPGPYTVSAELSGFTAETRPDIVLVIDQTAILNFTLKPATVSETVTVRLERTARICAGPLGMLHFGSPLGTGGTRKLIWHNPTYPRANPANNNAG